MGHSLCSFILRQIPRRSPTHNAVYFTTTRLGGYISKIVYWLARSDFIRPFAGLCSECTRARTGKEASTKAD